MGTQQHGPSLLGRRSVLPIIRAKAPFRRVLGCRFQVAPDGGFCMLSAIIATQDSERTLVPTLAALVPGAVSGLIAEAIVADAGSRDATADVADLAGCRLIVLPGPLGARLKTAAATARAPWLLFLRAGTVPAPGWIEACDRFMQATDAVDGAARAAVFRPPAILGSMRPGLPGFLDLMRVVLRGGARPEQGLLIARRFYESFGGHDESAEAEAALLRRLGRRRIAMLACAASPPR
jgi:glycosyltransferase involved in cell wall biosynthesis